MCGIVGYSGKRSAQEVLLNGLEKLEYRGYDSAGVALALEGGIHVVKSKGRLEVLRRKLEAENLPESFCGIGHTRWATHGEPSDVNSHPHSTPRVSIVHNGIIENYGPLKADLMAKGVTFESETDTEVLVKLIDYFCCAQPKQSPLAALREALAMVRGSYALGVLFREEPDTIYAVKKESPLIVGWGGRELRGLRYSGPAQVHPPLQRPRGGRHGGGQGRRHPVLRRLRQAGGAGNADRRLGRRSR